MPIMMKAQTRARMRHKINNGGDRERKREIDKVVANWRQFLFDSSNYVYSIKQ